MILDKNNKSFIFCKQKIIFSKKFSLLKTYISEENIITKIILKNPLIRYISI